MPKNKNVVMKPKSAKKQKLSPAERSQIAKDRWAKRRKSVSEVNTANAKAIVVDWPESKPEVEETLDPHKALLDEAVANAPEGADRVDLHSPQGNIIASQEIAQPAPVAPPIEVPVAQLTPVAPKKPKRCTGPKEFSVALKAAEGRLAKAVVERAEAAAKMAYLQAEIPSLMGIIQALRGSQGTVTVSGAPAAFDMSGSFPNAAAFQSPIVQSPQNFAGNPLQAIQAAQVAPPISKAQGGAMQFGPEVFGELEGPEDEDEDRFISGPAAGSKGWI
jgi:hypothetical protein